MRIAMTANKLDSVLSKVDKNKYVSEVINSIEDAEVDALNDYFGTNMSKEEMEKAHPESFLSGNQLKRLLMTNNLIGEKFDQPARNQVIGAIISRLHTKASQYFTTVIGHKYDAVGELNKNNFAYRLAKRIAEEVGREYEFEGDKPVTPNQFLGVDPDQFVASYYEPRRDALYMKNEELVRRTKDPLALMGKKYQSPSSEGYKPETTETKRKAA